jgi:hypothetical protein
LGNLPDAEEISSPVAHVGSKESLKRPRGLNFERLRDPTGAPHVASKLPAPSPPPKLALFLEPSAALEAKEQSAFLLEDPNGPGVWAWAVVTRDVVDPDQFARGVGLGPKGAKDHE